MKIRLLFLFLFVATSLRGQDLTVVCPGAGKLAMVLQTEPENLTPFPPKVITSLKIIGEMNSADFSSLRRYGREKLRSIDLGEVRIAEYHYTASNPKDNRDYPADWLPVGAFYSLNVLTAVKLPTTLKGIMNNAFDGCKNLTSINIPDGVTEIGSSAFIWCERLASIRIPSSVTRIGSIAFMDCKSLTSLTLPASVNYLEGGIFSGCDKLTAVYLENPIPPHIAVSPPEDPMLAKRWTPEKDFAWEFIHSKSDPGVKTFYVPRKSLKAYRDDPVWGKMNLDKY